MQMKKAVTISSVILIILSLLVLPGCTVTTNQGDSQVAMTQVDASSGGIQNRFSSEPKEKPGGGKYRIAYVDIDEYPVTGGMFYYVVESLKQDGWISYDSLPMSADNVDAQKLVNWLAAQDLGPYLEFVSSANYYLAYEGEEAVAKSLRDHVLNKKDIDLIFAMGTWPGIFTKNLDLNVPLMVYGTVDPIRAGIVQSVEDSGDDRIWAQVDPSAFTRQLQFYYDTLSFTNIGMVYNDEIVASIPDYEKTAAANGFTITKVKIDKLESNDPAARDNYYAHLKETYTKMITENKIDAYLINTDVITDDEYMKELFAVFYEAKIPIYVQIGDNYIKNGAFMLVSPRDYKGLGAFVSYVLGAILNGAQPRELPQEYTSSPYLSINLDVAEKLGFTPTFEMLLSSEYIYTGENE